VVGVGEDNLSLSLMLDISVEDTLHRRSSAYGHKYWGLYITVVGLNKASTRFATWCRML
jgi:hypothetical protein